MSETNEHPPTPHLVHNATERESLELALEAAVAYIRTGDPAELKRCLAHDAKLAPRAKLTLVENTD